MSGSEKSLFILDTNVVLYLLGNRLVTPLPSGQFLVSIITEIELLSYPNLGLNEEQQIRNFLAEITVVSIEMMIKEKAIALRKQHRLRLPDAIIVDTAIALDANLLTNDAGLLNLSEVNVKSISIT